MIWVFPKTGVPPNHPILIGFSLIFTIHFGGFSPYFWFNTHMAIAIPWKNPRNPKKKQQLNREHKSRNSPGGGEKVRPLLDLLGRCLQGAGPWWNQGKPLIVWVGLREPPGHTPGWAYQKGILKLTPKWLKGIPKQKLLVGNLGYVPGVCWNILRFGFFPKRRMVGKFLLSTRRFGWIFVRFCGSRSGKTTFTFTRGICILGGGGG